MNEETTAIQKIMDKALREVTSLTAIEVCIFWLHDDGENKSANQWAEQAADELSALRAELETAQSELQEKAREISFLNAELSEVQRKRERLEKAHIGQVDYSVALHRAIEFHCRGKEVPEHIAKECPHHADMLNATLKRGQA